MQKPVVPQRFEARSEADRGLEFEQDARLDPLLVGKK
jgi:hypothetical protein